MQWFMERWLNPGQIQVPALLLAAGLVAVLLTIRPLWLLARNAVTIVHEMGHVGMAFVCGRRIDGVWLHTDTSGLAVTRGSSRGLGMLLTALAGYPAPGVVGLALTWAAFSGHSGAALVLLTALLALAFLLVRNLWGGLILAAALTGIIAVVASNDAALVGLVSLGVGLFLALGSVRATLDVIVAHVHGRAGASDAKVATQSSLIPAPVWLVFFLGSTGACALASAVLAFGSL